MENICWNSCNTAGIDMLFGTTELEVKVLFADNPKLTCFVSLCFIPLLHVMLYLEILVQSEPAILCYAGWGWRCIYLFNFIIMACALAYYLRFLCISVSK